MNFDATNWYWIVGGTGATIAADGDPFTGDDSRVYSSAANQYLSSSDGTYLAWQADAIATSGLDPTTRIDSEASLTDVLAVYEITPNFS